MNKESARKRKKRKKRREVPKTPLGMTEAVAVSSRDCSNYWTDQGRGGGVHPKSYKQRR